MVSLSHLSELMNISNLAYEPKLTRQIVEHRRTLENSLFIDRLLDALGIDHTLYPPPTAEDLRSLEEQISGSKSPDHHKLSIVYYIVQDLSQRKPEVAESWVVQSYLPKSYRIFIDGIWHLDRLQLDKALDYLTEPSLLPTFPEEIMYTLCRHSPQGSYDHVMAYYNSVSSCIQSEKVLEAVFRRVCDASVPEAFYFARSKGEPLNQRLFENLLKSVMKLPNGSEKGGKSAELVLLPLNAQEEAFFSKYLNSGSGSKLPGAVDTIMMREVATGKQFKSTSRKKRSHRRIDGLDWTALSNAGGSDKAFG